MEIFMSGTLVLLSGGQDSGTCLFWAQDMINRGVLSGPLHALTISYGQRHEIEITCACHLAEMTEAEHEILGIGEFMRNLNNWSALLNSELNVNDASTFNNKLPASFVPGRNVILLTIAAIHASWKNINTVVAGMCQTDEAGYPDCRDTFIEFMEHTLRLALERPDFRIVTPLMYRTKAETWKLAAELGVLDTIVEHTHTDYNGDHTTRNEWGYGTLDNPASKLRAEGFYEARENGWL